MKAKLSTLAKRLDFKSEGEYFDYCIDSYTNGNFRQCEELFNAMKKEDQKAFLNYLNAQAQFNGKLQVRNFYFNLI
jgi:hypothetical protein